MFNIGDNIKVKNTGYVYSSFMSMADRLNAELNPDDWLKYGNGEIAIPRTASKKVTKWTFGATPSREESFRIINWDSSTVVKIYLIESNSTGSQFLISGSGIKLYPEIFLEDDLFEMG